MEALGNVIGLPGSMVRDALTLNNPLDQLLTPLSGENRVTPQEMLHKMGVEGDSPWLSLGLDMATDPLNLIGLGAGVNLARGIKGANLVGKAKGGLSSIGKALSSPEEFAKAKAAWWPKKAAAAADDAVKSLSNAVAPVSQSIPQAGYGGMSAMMKGPPIVGTNAGYGGFSSFMPPSTSVPQAVAATTEAATAVAPKTTGIGSALQRAFFDPNYRNIGKGLLMQSMMNEANAQEDYNRQAMLDHSQESAARDFASFLDPNNPPVFKRIR